MDEMDETDKWQQEVNKIYKQIRLDKENFDVFKFDSLDQIAREEEADNKRYGRGVRSEYYTQKRDELAKLINEKEKELPVKENKYWNDLVENSFKNDLKSEIKPEDKTDIEESQSYKDTVINLKKQREAFMKDHFEEMASISRDPNITPKEVQEFIDRNTHYMSLMAQNHYKIILDHPENPHYKQTLENLKKDKTEQQAQKTEPVFKEPEKIKPMPVENPVDTTGDLYQKMIQKYKNKGYSW